MHRYLRGNLYFADLDPVIGSEQAGRRPVLVIQNNTGNRFSPTLIIASVSSKPDVKPKLPTHCFIKPGEILKQPSLVLLEQIRTIDKSRLQGFIGQVDDSCMKEVDHALAVSLGLIRANSSVDNFFFYWNQLSEHERETLRRLLME